MSKLRCVFDLSTCAGKVPPDTQFHGKSDLQNTALGQLQTWQSMTISGLRTNSSAGKVDFCQQFP